MVPGGRLVEASRIMIVGSLHIFQQTINCVYLYSTYVQLHTSLWKLGKDKAICTVTSALFAVDLGTQISRLHITHSLISRHTRQTVLSLAAARMLISGHKPLRSPRVGQKRLANLLFPRI